MRTNIKSKFGFLVSLLTLFVITSSCEKDLYEDGIKNNSKNLSVKLVSLKSDLSRSNSKLTKALNLLNQKQKNEDNRIVYDSILNFYFDDEKGIYIEDGIKNSYTFPIFRNSTDVNDNIENLLFDLNSNGEYDIYLVKYDISIANLSNISFQEFEQIEKEYMAIQVEGRATLDLVCIDVQQYLLVSDSSGNSMSTTAPTYYYDWVTTSSQCGWVSGNSEPINTNTGTNGGTSSYGGTGGGASSNSTNIYTGVVSLSPEELSIKNFILNLPVNIKNWYILNPSTHQPISEYLEEHDYSEESEEFILNMINMELSNTPIIVGPNNPIENMIEYLECFDLTLGAQITIHADQPVTNTNWAISSSGNVGHSFITIKQGTEIMTFGFYPAVGTGFMGNVTGVMNNDQSHTFDVSLTMNIDATTLQNIILHSVESSVENYNLNNNNCTDFIIEISDILGLSIPDCYSSWGLGGGSNPGKFGQFIRNMTLPIGVTRNVLGGNAPANHKGC